LRVFECVPNVSEGRDAGTIDACAAAIEGAGVTLANRTSDALHNRSVFTFFGAYEAVLGAAVALAGVAAARIDLRVQRGAHPRIGALDVLPVVAFGAATTADAVALARDAAVQIWERFGVPSYFYGDAALRPEHRLLADVRRGEFEGLAQRSDPPDAGGAAHPSAGAVAVGVRGPLVAFNVVLASGDPALARGIARRLRERGGGLRTLRVLGIALGPERVQISCNLTEPAATPLFRVVRLVRALAAEAGVRVERTELIGLLPREAVEAVAADAFDSEVRSRDAQNSG
jgi:glutamate formiminotransferase